MKKNLLASLFIMFAIQSIIGQNLSVLTYNIRLDLDSDGENAWTHRKDWVCGLLKYYEPDVFGVQEAVPTQMSYIDSSLVNYSYIGMGRNGGNNGEFSAVFFKTTRFKVIQQSTFWLSETPDTFSIGWDASYPRICTYALFKDSESGKKFWVFNLHLDHIGNEARIKGAKLVIQMIEKLNKDNFPVILMGDFNATIESEPIQYIGKYLVNTRESSQMVYGSYETFNGFKFHEPATQRIDYIFTSPNGFKIIKYGVLTDSYQCRYPSDHFPVMANLEWE
jgi:endonuclease/exonuclease/phosphatase family metal-dependent hydrolase